MDASNDNVRCGLCGQVRDARHEQHHEEPAVGAGRSVEYVVVELRGATAHCQAVDEPTRMFRTGGDVLSGQLGIALPDLLGCHYRCWETPGEYGVFRRAFELV
ncbi:hypothetical protein ABZ565_12605 [Streptomyces sp. NPDC016469]|uniref:hypothetical protein n=1 Tax=Streptomyces sp. NPDC016469 TaxID=3157191 RepID=UPI0033E9141D